MASEEARGVPFEGEVLLAWGRAGTRPVLLAAIHHVGAPGGPTVEVAVGGLAPGRRPRLMRRVLASTDSSQGGPAAIKWYAQGSLREVNWEQGGLRLWAGIGRLALPVRLPAWVLGERASGRLLLPTRALVARFEVESPSEGLLAHFGGRHRGLLFSTARWASDPPWLRIPIPKRVEAAPEAF